MDQLSQIRLVGKVMSNKQIRKNIVQSIIRQVWFTKDLVRVEELAPNIFLFSFKTASNIDRIWNKQPWSLNGSHLVLREWKLDLSFEEINFNLSTFWVQIHGLPL